MMRWRCGVLAFSAVLVLTTMTAFAADVIVQSARLPEATPWDLKQLSEPPAFEWVDEKSSVRSLFYEGEPYGGKATRVFAYFASPATLSEADSRAEKFPAMVLIHGGGGTAFREWAELWAERGYAAITMDLAGRRPNEGQNAHQAENRTRLPDGGPNQGDDGTNDFAYPLDRYMKSFDAVPGTKQMRVTVNLPHGHPQGWAPSEIGLFINHHLGRGPALPNLADPKIENGRVRVAVPSEVKLKQASLHYSTDGDAINNRTWKTTAATIDGTTITVEAAPADATVWFITVTDDRDAVVSSRIAIR